MQHIRYLNLFEKICKVRPEYCFAYNSTMVFILPKSLVSKSIGPQGKNCRKLHDILNKKIKVVGKPSGVGEIKEFITNVVSPTGFKEITIDDEGRVIVQAGRINKANLIGRNKTRLAELQKVVKIYFDKELKVV